MGRPWKVLGGPGNSLGSFGVVLGGTHLFGSTGWAFRQVPWGSLGVSFWVIRGSLAYFWVVLGGPARLAAHGGRFVGSLGGPFEGPWGSWGVPWGPLGSPWGYPHTHKLPSCKACQAARYQVAANQAGRVFLITSGVRVEYPNPLVALPDTSVAVSAAVSPADRSSSRFTSPPFPTDQRGAPCASLLRTLGR